MSKLNSKKSQMIAEQYLKHEFRKIFHDIKEKNIWERLDRSIAGFIKREGEVSFWSLVASVSEGLKLKHVFHIISDTKYKWELKNISLDELVLTGMSPDIDKYTIEKCERSPRNFIQAWKVDKKIRQKIKLQEYSERDHFPIFVYQAQDGYHVFDGMRRTLLALTKEKKSIKAWVGRGINIEGKPLISADRCYFLANIYTRSKNKNKKLEESIIKIGQEIVGNYRNGREVLIDRIAGWSHDKDIKRIFKKMLK
jgi:hypothetical protein